MPIKPENKARYPADWKAISTAVKESQGWRCHFCKAQHGTIIARGQGRFLDTYMTDDAEVYSANSGEMVGYVRMSDYDVKGMVKVVLTTAHLDHTPENCAPSNLRALCQQCHLRYDALHHAATAMATRRAKALARQPELFDVAPRADGGS